MKLKELRIDCQITQQELAQKIGVKRSTLAMWENGKAQPPLSKIVLISSALNVSTGEILNCFLNTAIKEK